jgi:hypothetical protein
MGSMVIRVSGTRSRQFGTQQFGKFRDRHCLEGRQTTTLIGHQDGPQRSFHTDTLNIPEVGSVRAH